MLNSKDLLKSEQQIAPLTIATSIASTLSGFTIYFTSIHNDWTQWTILTHVFVGVLLSLILLPYIWLHFKRTIGFRRPSLLLSGLITIPLFLTFVYTAGHLMWHGQQENKSWVLQTHIVSAIVFIILLLAHLIAHRFLLPEKRKQSSQKIFASFTSGAIKHIILFNFCLLFFIVSAALISDKLKTSYSSKPVVEVYQYNYGPHPFRPSQTETFHDQFIDTRQIANSHRCISCHEELGNQWISSVHRQAASDPSYVTNVSLLAEKKGISATRYCEGCHAPVALLTGELSPGGKHGGILNTPANHEGVSCMSCHGIESLPHLKGVASYSFKPAKDYLFAQSNNPLLLRVHDWLIRLKPDQHKRDLARPILKDPKICSACHTQFMDEDMNSWGWIKMQDEYGAWLESPYSQQNQEDFSNSARVSCQDCHMPLVNSSDPSANSNGKVKSHFFPGANTILPLLNGDEQQLQTTIDFLQANKVRVSIETPNRKDAVQNLQAIDENLRNFEEAPYYFYIGERANINVVVSNNGVGHSFPGGTIDINEVWIDFKVSDAEGNTVFRSGELRADKHVDPKAYFYKSIPVDRQGKHVWKHDLFNMVGESFKRVIKAGESDIVNYQFDVPSWTKPPITVSATVKYRKFNQQYAEWALKDLYTDIPIVNMAWDSLSIPIRIRKEVE